MCWPRPTVQVWVYSGSGSRSNLWHPGVHLCHFLGLQTCFHLTKFSWPGTQSHMVRECTHSWYAFHYQSIPCLCGNPGMFNYWHPLCSHLILSYAGPLCSHFHPSLFLHRSCNRFQVLLQYHSQTAGRSRGEGWSQSVNDMVESVRCLDIAWTHTYKYSWTNISAVYGGWRYSFQGQCPCKDPTEMCRV